MGEYRTTLIINPFILIEPKKIHRLSLLSHSDAGGTSIMASLEITLWETNDFPPVLVPVSGIVCSNRERHRLGLLISAVDDDLAPHADPFTFDLTDGDLASNWTIIQLNGLKKNCHQNSASHEQ